MHHPSSRRPAGGHAAILSLFWLFAVGLMAAPFFLERDGVDPETPDPGRLVSEVDFAFTEDLANFEADFELDLKEHILTATDARYTLGSKELHANPLFDFNRLESGHKRYIMHCAGCHGIDGNGAGPAARHLEPRPRNFRRGMFKFTSTSSGQPPQRRDLFQTITRGLKGSSMPSFHLLSEELRLDLVEYVRYLSVRGAVEQLMVDLAWDEEELPDPQEAIDIIESRWKADSLRSVYPPVPETERSAEELAHAREMYLSNTGAGCAACHGETGIGDGPSASDFTDDWGYPIVPRDLTTGVFRAGSESADLYRSIATGITGTPMPSYGGSLSPEDIWGLVHFVQSLSEVPQ